MEEFEYEDDRDDIEEDEYGDDQSLHADCGEDHEFPDLDDNGGEEGEE